MATTGELRAIIEELELIDIGDAASYLGEEATMSCGFSSDTQEVQRNFVIHDETCGCVSCQILKS